MKNFISESGKRQTMVSAEENLGSNARSSARSFFAQFLLGILAMLPACGRSHSEVIGENAPICIPTYLKRLAESNKDPTCKQVVKELISIAELNVHKINCRHGSQVSEIDWEQGNVIFLTPRVFVTVAHIFHHTEWVNHRAKIGKPYQANELYRCVIETNGKEMAIIPESVNRGDAHHKFTMDYAAGLLQTDLPQFRPLKILTDDDLEMGDELLMVAAFDPNGAGCPSVVSCQKRFSAIPPDLNSDDASLYITDCSGTPGTSGSPVFGLLKSQDRKRCIGFGLMAINQGGIYRAKSGAPFYYSPAANNKTPENDMWSAGLGLDGQFSHKIDSAKREVDLNKSR